ncbi:hypothetical protein T439DRAFT_328696 [Meredithblackwellia eburnea MCA 4105]
MQGHVSLCCFAATSPRGTSTQISTPLRSLNILPGTLDGLTPGGFALTSGLKINQTSNVQWRLSQLGRIKRNWGP